MALKWLLCCFLGQLLHRDGVCMQVVTGDQSASTYANCRNNNSTKQWDWFGSKIYESSRLCVLSWALLCKKSTRLLWFMEIRGEMVQKLPLTAFQIKCITIAYYKHSHYSLMWVREVWRAASCERNLLLDALLQFTFAISTVFAGPTWALRIFLLSFFFSLNFGIYMSFPLHMAFTVTNNFHFTCSDCYLLGLLKKMAATFCFFFP